MVRRTVVALLALVVLPSIVEAQQSPVYVGGTFNLVTQPHSDDEPLGGTATGGSLVVGVQVSRRFAIEFEPSFGRQYAWEYTYRPGPSRTADVVASRRDSFFSFQLRTRTGMLEPVVGVSYIRGRISRQATTAGTTYFYDSRSDDGLAAVAGLDAPVKCASHFYFVPTFRLLARLKWAGSSGDPLEMQTRTGPLVFRYGAGVRVTF